MKKIKKALSEIRCVCAYSLKLYFRYPMNCIWLVATPLIYICLVGWLMGIIGTEIFIEQTGGAESSILYSAVGYAIFSISNYSWQSSGKIEREMVMGTLKQNFLLPIHPANYIYGLIMSTLLSTGSMSIIILVICLIAAGASLLMILQSLLFIVLAVIYFFGIALVMSSMSLRYKSLSGMANILTFVMQMLTGLIIPIRSLPSPIKELAYISPTTWAIDSVRSSLLGLDPLIGFEYELIILLSFALIANIAGQLCLRRSCRFVRMNGLMDDF